VARQQGWHPKEFPAAVRVENADLSLGGGCAHFQFYKRCWTRAKRGEFAPVSPCASSGSGRKYCAVMRREGRNLIDSFSIIYRE